MKIGVFVRRCIRTLSSPQSNATSALRVVRMQMTPGMRVVRPAIRASRGGE